MKYTLDDLCGGPKVSRKPLVKPPLTGIQKVEAEQAEAKKFWIELVNATEEK